MRTLRRKSEGHSVSSTDHLSWLERWVLTDSNLDTTDSNVPKRAFADAIRRVQRTKQAVSSAGCHEVLARRSSESALALLEANCFDMFKTCKEANRDCVTRPQSKDCCKSTRAETANTPHPRGSVQENVRLVSFSGSDSLSDNNVDNVGTYASYNALMQENTVKSSPQSQQDRKSWTNSVESDVTKPRPTAKHFKKFVSFLRQSFSSATFNVHATDRVRCRDNRQKKNRFIPVVTGSAEFDQIDDDDLGYKGTLDYRLRRAASKVPGGAEIELCWSKASDLNSDVDYECILASS